MKKLFCLLTLNLVIAVTARSQSFDPELANKLQNRIDSIRNVNNLKGISACVIYPGVGTWQGVTGISHPGTPITPDMEFGIGSNTKLFTGVLLLKLAENNLLELDDSLYNYLPVFNNVDPNITIRQLLNHTSGLADVNDVAGYSDSIFTDPYRMFTPAEVIKWIGPPLFSAGKGWSYCNTNYILGGMIAESVTGKSFGQLLRDSILFPLQLDSTFLGVYDSILYTVAHPWQGGADKYSTPRKALNSVAWAAGAMYSTSGEMARWYHELMNGQVLNSKSFHDMTTFVGSGKYGIGISSTNVLGRTVWQHGGTIWGGYNSSMVYDTTTGIVICVLINQLPAQALQVSAQLLSILINNPVGANENLLQDLPVMIYPNPSTGFVQTSISDQTILGIKVFDLRGQLIKETNESQFSVTDHPNGMYLIKVQTDKGVYISRLIKQ